MKVYGMIKSDMSGIMSLPKSETDTLIVDYYDLSDQTDEIVDQGNIGSCVSLAVTDMLKFISKQQSKDLVIDDRYFYDKRSDKSIDGMSPREAFEIAKEDFGIKLYSTINDPLTMRASVMSNGPVLIGLPVMSDSDEFWRGSDLIGYHAVLVTGFSRDYFILKNSWGYGFGDKGFTKLYESDFRYITEAWTIFI